MATPTEPYTDNVVEAFDSVAEIFDETFENEVTRRLRHKIYNVIESLILPDRSILDINCGTGIDAIALERRGYEVVGVDISPKMIQCASQKAARSDVSVNFMIGSFEHLTATTTDRYDLVLSNFGGLNCIKGLERVAEEVASVTKPGGYFAAVVMPPMCLWEVTTGIVRLNFRSAFRRLRKNVQATGFHGRAFEVFYHSPRTFVTSFQQWFGVREVRGFNIFSPPPHAAKFRKDHSLLSSVFDHLDQRIDTLPGFRAMGDHYLIIMKKR